MQLAVTYVAQKYRKKKLLFFLSIAFYIYYIVDNHRKYVRHKKGEYFAFAEHNGYANAGYMFVAYFVLISSKLVHFRR